MTNTNYVQSTLFLLLLLLPSTAFAGDILFVAKGQVRSVPPGSISTGPFTGTSVGDSVQLSMEFIIPGFVQGQDYAAYHVDHAQTSLVIGSGHTDGENVTPDVIPFQLYDDLALPGYPQVDLLWGYASLQGAGIFVSLEDAQGQMFSSSDLSQQIGAYTASGNTRIEVSLGASQGTVLVDLDTFEFTDLGPIGISYCGPAVSNATGLPGVLLAFGSNQVSTNRISLFASNIPIGRFGLLIASETQGFVSGPGGSAGNLCLGGAIGRFSTQAQVSDAQGVMSFEVDLANIAQPMGPVVGISGQTWNFQVWHRGLPGQASNFTQAVSIPLQ